MGELIICGIDESDGGREALTVATSFAELLGARLVPVHVLPDKPAVDHVQLERDRRAAAERFGAISGPEAGERREELLVESGAPAERLAALARERSAAMLVVGSRGRGALKRAVLGSVTGELLAGSPCPVLVVPPGAVGRAATRWARRPRPASVLCGVDGSPESHAATDLASNMAARMGKRLLLVYVYRPDTSHRGHASILMHYPGLLWRERDAGRKVLEDADQRLTRLPVPDLRLALGDPARALRRLALRERAELIVVGSRGRGAMRVVLSGSVAGALAASAPAPVLVVPPSAVESEPVGI